MTDAASRNEILIRDLLRNIGDNPQREGLLDTPSRVAKAYQTWFCGYGQDPQDLMKVFVDGSEGVDTMVLETDIPVYSHCEHHIAPIFGLAHVAYIPNGRVVGLSKLARVVDCIARRLQVQERMTEQIADALDGEALRPGGVGVVLQCRHLCMESRGIHAPGIVTTTSSLRGAIRDEPDCRAEFLNLIAMSKSGRSSVI